MVVIPVLSQEPCNQPAPGRVTFHREEWQFLDDVEIPPEHSETTPEAWQIQPLEQVGDHTSSIANEVSWDADLWREIKLVLVPEACHQEDRGKGFC